MVQGVQEGVREVREEQEEEVEQRGMEVRVGREGQKVMRKEREGKRE